MIAKEGLRRLSEGNQKFVSKHDGIIQRHISGQKPFAAVLTCSDSRVIPEYIFDAGIGEIFVVRDAGNMAFGASVIGSLEYAVEHLHVPLILILGHTHCGAVMAAEQGPGENTCEGELVNEVRQCFGGGDHVRDNLMRQLAELPKRSAIIANAMESGELAMKGAVYRLEDGTVEFL